MAKKVFTSNFVSYVKYELQEEKWLDKDTYLLVFQDMTDKDGETCHLEVEYHVDEDKFTYTRVYADENVDAIYFVSATFKNQFMEYVLKQIGKIDDDTTITTSNIEVSLKLAVPLNMMVHEFKEWLDNISIQVTNENDKVKILDVIKK